MRLARMRGTCKLRTELLTGLRCFGPTKSMGSEVTGRVVRRTRESKGLGPNSAVVRPASKGAKVKLTTVTTTGKCGVVVILPRAVSVREEGVVGTCNTRLILSSNAGNVGKTVTGTRRLRRRVPSDFVPRRFRGPTGPRTREGAANPRV